jgi:hypothetical protein
MSDHIPPEGLDFRVVNRFDYRMGRRLREFHKIYSVLLAVLPIKTAATVYLNCEDKSSAASVSL